MAATATPDPPVTTALLELAVAVGYQVTAERWRARAACAGVDPEVFLPGRGEHFKERCPTAGGADGAWLTKHEHEPVVSLAKWSGEPLHVCADAFRGGKDVLAAFVRAHRGGHGRMSTAAKLMSLRIQQLRWLIKDEEITQKLARRR
jgi:hypothetical protein